MPANIPLRHRKFRRVGSAAAILNDT